MYDQDKAVLQSLVTVAWADGTFAEREKEMLEALIESFGADEAEADEIRAFAETKRGLEDVPLTELSADDRRLVMQHAVVLTWVDGDQDETEVKFLEDLRAHMRIPEDEGKELFEVATARAKNLLKLLEEDEASA